MSNDLTAYPIECFRDIVGLSRITCDCYDENLNWDESYSGLFVDEAEGMSLKMINATKDCENDNNLWLLMDTARGNAIRQFIADTNNRLLSENILARSAFSGNIGRYDYKAVKSSSKTYNCQRWATANVVGGYVHISNITTFFSAVGTVDVTIYNNLNDIVVAATTLITANGKTSNAVDITLPMWNVNTTELEYIFVYTYDALNKPKDNSVGCTNCGLNYLFDTVRPYYISGSNKLAGWSKWLMAGNMETDTLDFSDMETTAGNYSNGLSFTVDFYCDLGRQFCFDEPDIYDPTFLTVAHAIQSLTAYKLAISIVASPNVSRYTMVNHETLVQAIMPLHLKIYNDAVDWLIKNADIKNTDCIKCRDKIKMGVGIL